MSPQLVDINGDGHKDILVGTFEGVAYLVPGNEKGFGKPEHILDSNKETILINQFWDNEAEQWTETERASNHENRSEGHCTTVSAVDWENDGDLDLLLGDHDEGRIYVRLNTGTAKEPDFVTYNFALRCGEEDLKVPGGLANIKVVDWNGDQLFDLVCGGAGGGAFLFTNTGTVSSPEFDPAETLIEPFDSSQGFTTVPNMDGQPLSPGTSFHVDVVDYDHDGDLDLLVGGQSAWFTKPPRKQTDDDRARIKEMQSELRDLYAKMESLTGDVDETDEAAIEKVHSSKEYQTLEEDMSILYEESSELSSYPDGRGDFVWLYRRK